MATRPQSWAEVAAGTLEAPPTNDNDDELEMRSALPWPPNATAVEQMQIELDTVRVHTSVRGEVAQTRLCPTQDKRIREGSSGHTPTGKQPMGRTPQQEDLELEETATNLEHVRFALTSHVSLLALSGPFGPNEPKRRKPLREIQTLQLYDKDEPRGYAYDRSHSVQARIHRNQPNAADQAQAQEDEWGKIFISNPDNTISFQMDDVAMAILEQLSIVEIVIDSTELFVTYSSNRGPFSVTLPQEAAQIFIDEGRLNIATSKEGEEPKSVAFKVSRYVEKKAATASSVSKFRTINAYRSAEVTIFITFHLPKEHPVGLLEKGAHDIPFQKIKQALFEVYGNPEQTGKQWDYVFDQPTSLTLGLRRHALRAFIKYDNGPNKPEPEDYGDFLKLKYIPMGRGQYPIIGHINEDIRSMFEISSCCFRDDCKINNAAKCPFKIAFFKEWEVPEPIPPHARPSQESQTKKRARTSAQNAKWEQIRGGKTALLLRGQPKIYVKLTSRAR